MTRRRLSAESHGSRIRKGAETDYNQILNVLFLYVFILYAFWVHFIQRIAYYIYIYIYGVQSKYKP